MVPVSVRPGHDERRAGSARSRGPSCPAVSGRSGQPAGRRARSPPCRGRPSAISSDRAHWHPAGNGFRGWNSTGRTRVLPPVGALVSPGPDHCLHGIPSGWSHDAPSAVRRPAHRLRHALASRRSGGAVISDPPSAGRDSAAAHVLAAGPGRVSCPAPQLGRRRARPAGRRYPRLTPRRRAARR
jgi:hypothetical protein